jgi:hypothetical protein
VHSPYRDVEVAQRHGTTRNAIWKSAGPKPLFHRGKPKNIIEKNIRAIRRLNNTNLLNRIDNDGVNFQKLNIFQKASLLNPNIDRGDDYIIFKKKPQKPKTRGFDRVKLGTSRLQKRALSMIGVGKIKALNPNSSKFNYIRHFS